MNRPLQKILHVDDEPMLCRVVKVALEKVGGLTVQSAGSGPEALAAVPEFEPDLILLDVMMPDLDGPETVRQLRATEYGRRVPVVFMTAKTDPNDLAALQPCGAAGIIMKPFDPLELPARLQQIWGELGDAGHASHG